MAASTKRPPKKVVYSKTITLKNGKVLHAKDYGLQAFRFEV